jgi:hypothetical protein
LAPHWLRSAYSEKGTPFPECPFVCTAKIEARGKAKATPLIGNYRA